MATARNYTGDPPQRVRSGDQVIEGQQERERLHEAVAWWESEYGAITEEELAEAEAERRRIERRDAETA